MPGSQLQKRNEAGKLSILPSLKLKYVEEQLRPAAGYVPFDVAKEVAQSGDPSKIREVYDALSKIAKAAGKRPKSALRSLAHKDVAKMFVANPKEFVRVAKAAKSKSGIAFYALRQAHIAKLFEADPGKVADYFIRIAKAAKKDAEGVFYLLANERVAASFASDPERMMRAFRELCSAPKKDNAMMFWILGSREISGSFAQNPMQHANAFSKICRAFGESSKYSFYLINDYLRSDFANNPEEISDALMRMHRAAGDAMGAVYEALVNFTMEFERNPRRVSEMFAQMAEICGRKKKQFFGLLGNEEIARALHNGPEEALKLAEASAYSNVLYHLGEYLEKGEKSRIDSAIMLLEQDPLEFAATYGIATLSAYKGSWKEGRALARASGVRIEDREVFLNFAYAKNVIGEGKTRAIHEKFGIEYFRRYSEEELENLYNHTVENADHRPLLLIAYNKYDDNGVFYKGIDARAPLIKEGKYNVIIFEAESEYEFYEMAGKFAEEYFGISALSISGHGQAGSIQLGPGGGEENFLDLLDAGALGKLHGLFAEGAIVILDSCLTGADEKAIGALNSRVWGTMLVAPKVPSTLKEFIRDEEDGMITDARYRDPRSIFVNGKLVEETPGRKKRPKKR